MPAVHFYYADGRTYTYPYMQDMTRYYGVIHNNQRPIKIIVPYVATSNKAMMKGLHYSLHPTKGIIVPSLYEELGHHVEFGFKEKEVKSFFHPIDSYNPRIIRSLNPGITNEQIEQHFLEMNADYDNLILNVGDIHE